MDSPNRFNFSAPIPRNDFHEQGIVETQAMMLSEQLQTSIGYYVSCDFLIGTQIIETRDGILAKVGTNFLTLYQPNLERYIVCDLYALKFITIYNSTSVPSLR
ncbi:MAG: hypothetical protein II996_00930 [Oscillospiraceae bacterium]|nr:hypothetical protein [Oscillospiraceae bacterium]MBQ4544119.1 hypothetical protein [Oscillospiraceae bacterium]MBQ6901791.1 hypothetical protein [Oscillospiraceae bacterium]